jgi:hypothetical protein
MTIDRPRGGSPVGFFAGAAVLIVLGIVGIVLYAVGAPDQAEDGSGLGALRGALIIGSALCGGLGALLAALGVVRRLRARR